MSHPLHPALVHVPVGLWLGAWVFDIASLIAGLSVSNFLVVSAFYSMLVGVIGAIPSALAGFAEFVDIPKGTRGHAVALLHMSLNITLLAGYIVQLFIRNTSRGHVEIGVFIFNTIELAAMCYSGFLGGKLAYEYRVGSRISPGKARSEIRRVA